MTPIFTPTHPNITRLRPTRLGGDPPEIPVCQGIVRHHPTPGHPLAGLEQNPAYRTAQARIYAACADRWRTRLPEHEGQDPPARHRDGLPQEIPRGAGLPLEVRFHDLRHTAGTLALRQGTPLHAVSRMLGHSDPAMTLRGYAHVLEDMREDAAIGRWMNSFRLLRRSAGHETSARVVSRFRAHGWRRNVSTTHFDHPPK